jgi:hypothetical protein
MKTVNKNAMLWRLSASQRGRGRSREEPHDSRPQEHQALLMYRLPRQGPPVGSGIGADADHERKLADTLNASSPRQLAAVSPRSASSSTRSRSPPGNIKIFANLPEALMTKLSKTAQATVEEKLGAGKTEEKKEEIKK